MGCLRGGHISFFFLFSLWEIIGLCVSVWRMGYVGRGDELIGTIVG